MSILSRLSKRLAIIENVDLSWKSPQSPNYDRQWAEDALYHTIGPLTDNPHWAKSWTSPSQPVPGFVPGGTAPQWTPEELIIAIAGDPNLLFSGSGNPRSPSYGTNGGAPIYRLAKRVARIYNRDRDKSFIADMYSNGLIPLTRMMQPGFDEGRSGFIPWVVRTIQGAMEHGIGGTEEGIRAGGGESTSGLVGLRGALESNDPQKVRMIADQIKGKYRDQKSHDRHPDNPFGPYSSRMYQTLIMYADALQSGDQDMIERARNQIIQLQEVIDDDAIPIRGAATGMGQAISTLDRTSSVGVASMDAEKPGSEGEGTALSNSMASDEHQDSWIDPESVNFILQIALEHDIGAVLASSEKYKAKALELGAKGGKIGGKLTANELRYVVRMLGPLGSNYPGKDRMRSAVQIPRDAVGWWRPGEDPEIEPIPTGGTWTSAWKRENSPQMGSTAIAQEMTNELREFEKLGIKSARSIKAKTDSRSGKGVEEAVSKVAVNNTAQTAILKLKIIADIHKSHLGLDESTKRALARFSFPLLENLDAFDRRMIVETCHAMISRIQRVMLELTTIPNRKSVSSRIGFEPQLDQ